MEGERKPVTVLCCDLANATALAERVGSEAVRTLVTRFFELAQAEVHRYEGTINEFAGDGFMALFGAPLAHEDHARRAILAARGIQQAVRERHGDLGLPPGAELAVRMGLNTGLVVVGRIGDDARMDATPVGETMDQAVGLQQLAQPGIILLSEATSRLVRGEVRLEALDPVQIKGKTERILAYKVLGLRPRSAPLLDARSLSDFVGRGQELAALSKLLAQVERGQGQVVGFLGEPGGGKSRLLYEFRQSLARRRVTFTYLEGRCLSYGSATPYLPVLDLLRQNCRIADPDSPEVMGQKVRASLREVGLNAQDSAPYLLHLLGVKEGTESLAGLSPEVVKARTFETLRQMSLQGSRRRPLILAVEDLHWIDHTSEEYFASVVQSLSEAPILLLATYRSGYRPPWLEQSHVSELTLGPLSAADSFRIILSVHQRGLLPDPLVRLILGKTGGNPFFLEELTRAVGEQGDRGQVAMPDTIQGVLLARIDRLSEAPKRLVQMASVLGREFSPRLLGAIWEGAEGLDAHLGELKRLEFLHEQTRGEEPVYVFKHALTQEVAYASMPLDLRQKYHGWAAQVLAERFPETVEIQPELLAHHYTEAGLGEHAIAYWQRAGERAAQGSAYVEAISHLTKGLELLNALPDTAERAQKEITLQLALGSSLMPVRGHGSPEVERRYTRARVLCQQIGEHPALFRVLGGLEVFYFARGELQTARQLGEQCLSLAQRAPDPVHLLKTHTSLGDTLVHIGELPLARAHLEQGIALYTSKRYRPRASLQDPIILCLSYDAWALWLLGYPDQALERIHQALALAQELSHPHNLVSALHYANVFHQLRRERQAVQERAEALITLSTEQEYPLWLGLGHILQGWVRSDQDGEKGIAQIHQGLAALQAPGLELGWPYYLALLVEAHGQVGQVAEGLRVQADAIAAGNKNGEHCWDAELYRLKGELVLRPAVPDAQQAATCFQQAIEIAHRQQAKSWELRAAMSLSRLWQQQGKREDARQLLAEIYAWFTEGFDTADLQEAKVLLEELS